MGRRVGLAHLAAKRVSVKARRKLFADDSGEPPDQLLDEKPVVFSFDDQREAPRYTLCLHR